MVLTKEQKEDLLKRLQEGKKQKALKLQQEKEQLEKEQLEKEQLQNAVPVPESVPEPIIKSEPIPIPKKEQPKIILDSDEDNEYYTSKKTIKNNDSSKGKYYNKEKGQPIMKIKLYKDTAETQALMKSIINNEKHNEKPKEEIKKENINIKNTSTIKTKEQLKKEYLDNLSKSFF